MPKDLGLERSSFFGFASVQCKPGRTETYRVWEGGKRRSSKGSFDGRQRVIPGSIHCQCSLWVRGEVTGEAQSPGPLKKAL